MGTYEVDVLDMSEIRGVFLSRRREKRMRLRY